MQLRLYDTAGDALRVGYDATHYLGVSVSSAGVIAIKESGTERGRISGGVLAWGTAEVASASPGDAVVAFGRGLRSVDGAGTDTVCMVRLNSVGADFVQIGDDGTTTSIVGIGRPATVSGAAPGDLVLGNSKALRGASAAGTAVQAMIFLDGFNQVQLGANDGSTVAGLVKLGGYAAASLPVAASARSLSIGFDTTNGRLVYYIGTSRYYLTGTTF